MIFLLSQLIDTVYVSQLKNLAFFFIEVCSVTAQLVKNSCVKSDSRPRGFNQDYVELV